jgi:DMSO/TMAO reductase YedYZ molybdopterin-dependent catalytic subunit
VTTTGPATAPTDLGDVSLPSRVADEDEGIGLDELGLAARNAGLPLELMRHDVTPLGAHYLLTHYDIPAGDPADWRVEVTGLVERPMSLTLADLRDRPVVTRTVTMECAGNGRARLLPRPVSQPWLNEAVGTMTWTGTPLAPLLAEAGVADGAVDVVFTGADHGVERGEEQDYARSLGVEEAVTGDAFLAWGCNGVDLPPQHGFPVRLVVPGWYGMASVKWLRRIEAVAAPFEGYQMRAYRLRADADDPGEPLTRIAPRALVIPPGFPDFMSRRRVLRVGSHLLQGRAWSGWGEVVSVEVTVDDGQHWEPADLDPPVDRWAWRRWSLPWEVTEPGHHVVRARATDETGRSQSLDQAWNRGGFANTTPQRVEVAVVP